MRDFFWFKCTATILAIKQRDFVLAQQLLKDAELIIDQGCHSEKSIEGRLSYLKKLLSHVNEVTTRGEKSCSYSLPIPKKGDFGIIEAENTKNNSYIQKLEQENNRLRDRLRTMPSIDPLCVSDTALVPPIKNKEAFGIILFGHTRLKSLDAILESLSRQGALKYTEVWLDGHQGNGQKKDAIEKTIKLVRKYPVKVLKTQAGNFGFRKMLILGLVEMSNKYKDILILEDDCFPTRNAVSEFRKELDAIRNNKKIFSVYGHHFLMKSEQNTCPRFQGWGWATTDEKLRPLLRQLIDCYSMTEERYFEFIKFAFTKKIKDSIDVTPPRQPSYTLERFFAWDETLCLLTALNGQVHKPTKERTIYNCGMGDDSTHFNESEMFRSPPFNLITENEVWKYF